MNTKEKTSVVSSFEKGKLTRDFDVVCSSSATMNEKQLGEEIASWKSSVSTKAHEIVFKLMPAKIIALTNLLKHPDYNREIRQLTLETCLDPNVKHSIETDNNSNKKRKLDTLEINDDKNSSSNGIPPAPVIPSNSEILEIVNLLRKEVLTLVEMINTVKIWIQLNIPRIEDGNNFGVSIQEETVGEITRVEDSAFSVLESISKYFAARAKLASKVLKTPTIMDYHLSITELDEKYYSTLRLCTCDLRNNYASLHDIIVKNLEKLKQPRTQTHLSTIF